MHKCFAVTRAALMTTLAIAALACTGNVDAQVSIKPKQHADIGRSVDVIHHLESHIELQTTAGTVTHEEIIDQTYVDTTLAASSESRTLLRSYGTAVRSVDGRITHRSYEHQTLKIRISEQLVAVTALTGAVEERHISEISATLRQQQASAALAALVPAMPVRTGETWRLNTNDLCSSLMASCSATAGSFLRSRRPT